jgi:hypothetical protein
LDTHLVDIREGWKHSHLFGGQGAYPYWRSTEPVAPLTPVAFLVDGGRGEGDDAIDVRLTDKAGQIEIRVDEEVYLVKVPE